jgi:hypothetical protein
MDKLSELYEKIDRLNRDEFRQLRAYVDQHVEPPQIKDETPHERAVALMAAVENFWEGMSQDEINAIVEDMNMEYIEPLEEDWLSEEEDH